MAETIVPFGQLLADESAYRNPGLIRVVNAIPRNNSFGPFRQLSAVTNALESRVLGAVSVRDVDDNVYIYAGVAAKLYEAAANSFADQSKVGGYSTAEGDNWELAVFGPSKKVIATNYTDPVQSIAIGGGSAGAFADMITSTSTPKAKHLGIIGPFVVLGFTNDATDGVLSNRVWWSGIRDETDFDPDSATQCDFDDLAAGGTVQRIIGGTEYGLIFQQQMVRTMRYVGGGTIFDLQPLNFAPGTPIPNSVISYKGQVFYISDAGFMALNGTQVDTLGDGRVDRSFWNQFDPNNRRYLSAAIDPINKIVAWAFPGAGATTLPNKIFMCKYDEKKWAEAEIDIEFLLATETQGYTLEGLDALGTDIDDSGVFSESFDSDLYKGGAFRFGAFDQLHQLGFFNGSIMTATFDTGDFSPWEGYRWRLPGVRPLVDGGGVRVSVASRERLQDSVNYGVSSTLNANGICPLNSEGRYQRLRISLSASISWEHASGIAFTPVKRGMR